MTSIILTVVMIVFLLVAFFAYRKVRSTQVSAPSETPATTRPNRDWTKNLGAILKIVIWVGGLCLVAFFFKTCTESQVMELRQENLAIKQRVAMDRRGWVFEQEVPPGSLLPRTIKVVGFSDTEKVMEFRTNFANDKTVGESHYIWNKNGGNTVGHWSRIDDSDGGEFHFTKVGPDDYVGWHTSRSISGNIPTRLRRATR